MKLRKTVVETFLKMTVYSILINTATDESNGRNKTWHWTNDETGVAVQSWLCVRVELMAWLLSRLDRLNGIQWSLVQIYICTYIKNLDCFTWTKTNFSNYFQKILLMIMRQTQWEYIFINILYIHCSNKRYKMQ